MPTAATLVLRQDLVVGTDGYELAPVNAARGRANLGSEASIRDLGSEASIHWLRLDSDGIYLRVGCPWRCDVRPTSVSYGLWRHGRERVASEIKMVVDIMIA
jgi:hypothetical protein